MTLAEKPVIAAVLATDFRTMRIQLLIACTLNILLGITAEVQPTARPSSDPDDVSVWPNQTSHANSDSWLAANHDKIRLMRPRLLLINFSNEHSRQHLDLLTKKLIAALAESR